MAPYILNVMNNATAAQIAAIQVNYRPCFPAETRFPFFTYTFDPPLGAAGCASALISPCNIRDVGVTLIVQSPQRDTTNQQCDWSS